MNPVGGSVGTVVRSLGALHRTWRGRFIIVFLLSQLLIPLHYYTVNDDPHDERFAWRMFSPMRMIKCRSSVLVDKQPINLGTVFHEAWAGEMIERGRMSVIDAMGKHLCAKNPGKPVEITLECTYFDRPDAKFGGYDVCKRTLE